MHPSELKNRAIVAASAATLGGFPATAQALLSIAMNCADEAKQTVERGMNVRSGRQTATQA